MSGFAVRFHDREHIGKARPGESLRAAAIRRARDLAIGQGMTPIGEPSVFRIDEGPPWGRGWRVAWAEARPEGDREV